MLASAENVLASIGEELGSFAERALRCRLKEACFFVGGIDEDLDATKKAHKRTIGQLQTLLAAINAIVEKPAPDPAGPGGRGTAGGLARRRTGEGDAAAVVQQLGRTV